MNLNPGSAVDLIDWRATLDESLTMAENVEVFEEAYPQFSWVRPEEVGPGRYAEMVIAGLAEEAEPYGYDLIRVRKLEGLERASRRAERLKVELVDCQEAPRRRVSLPGICKLKTVDVVAHRRCLPRALLIRNY